MLQRISLLLLLATVCSCYGDEFTHRAFLNHDKKYEMWWKFNTEDITIRLRVETNGWIGWGLSPNGKMENSDIVLAWFDQGKPRLQDSHVKETRSPIKDVSQDYELLEMKRDGGNTTVTFKRKLLLCNDEDMAVTTDTMRVIWAYGESEKPQYHETNRNTHSLLLVDFADKGSDKGLPKDYITRELRMNSTYVLEKKDTLYICKTFKVWDLREKHHLIRVEPIVQSGHENLIHHILLYDCRGFVNETYLNNEHDCNNANMPESLRTCRQIVIHAWAIGGTTMNYPDVAGFSFGGPNDPNYFMMEVHYDNPSLMENITDNSGLRFYLTKSLRKYDAAVFTFGSFTKDILIPQNQAEFKWNGFCESKCWNITETDKLKPQVFASFLHSHINGRKLIARLVRDSDGVETKRIAQDLSYDFNFQEIKTFSKPIEIPPGHSLHLECIYTTMGVKKPVLGGESTREEMCLGFLWYYPAYPNSWCATKTINGDFQRNVLNWKVDNKGNIDQLLIIDGTNYTGRGAWLPLQQEPSIWKPDIVKKWEDYLKLPTYTQLCLGQNKYMRNATPKLTKTLPLNDCVAKTTSSDFLIRQNINIIIFAFLLNLFL